MANAEVDPSLFTTDEIAADLNMLRLALGYSQFNLLGGGFGSQLALTMIRDYPLAVRSAVLFELSFPKEYLTAESNAVGMQNSLDLLFNRCLSDEKCRLAFPSFEQQFYTAVDQLNTRPAEIEVFFPDNSQLTPIKVSGSDFILLIHDLLRTRSTIAAIPKLVDNINSGRVERMAVELQQNRMNLPEEIVLGLEINTACEGLHANFWQSTPISRDVQPVILEAFQDEWRVYQQICPLWTGRELGLPAGQALTSEVPVLTLQGEFSPEYTPEMVAELMRGVKNAVNVVIPNVGDDTFNGTSCAGLLLYDWLNEPGTNLDTSCVNNTEPITFQMPEQ